MLLSCRRGKDKMGTDGNVVLLQSSPGGVGPWSVICEGFQHTWDGVRGEVRGSALVFFVREIFRLGYVARSRSCSWTTAPTAGPARM